MTASLLDDGHPRAAGVHGATAHWLLSSESVVCVRSYVVFHHGLTRKRWSPRHAVHDPASPSKPGRPHVVSRDVLYLSILAPLAGSAARWRSFPGVAAERSSALSPPHPHPHADHPGVGHRRLLPRRVQGARHGVRLRARVHAGRRRAQHRLERHRAHGRALRQAVRGGARPHAAAAGGPFGLAVLRVALPAQARLRGGAGGGAGLLGRGQPGPRGRRALHGPRGGLRPARRESGRQPPARAPSPSATRTTTPPRSPTSTVC